MFSLFVNLLGKRRARVAEDSQAEDPMFDEFLRLQDAPVPESVSEMRAQLMEAWLGPPKSRRRRSLTRDKKALIRASKRAACFAELLARGAVI